MTLYTLRITGAIASEWWVRCIGDIVPAIADTAWAAGQRLTVDRDTVEAIAADCRHMVDPEAGITTPAERRAYRALLAQCERALAIGPVDTSWPATGEA